MLPVLVQRALRKASDVVLRVRREVAHDDLRGPVAVQRVRQASTGGIQGYLVDFEFRLGDVSELAACDVQRCRSGQVAVEIAEDDKALAIRRPLWPCIGGFDAWPGE